MSRGSPKSTRPPVGKKNSQYYDILVKNLGVLEADKMWNMRNQIFSGAKLKNLIKIKDKSKGEN